MMIMQQATRELLPKLYPNSKATIPKLPSNLDPRVREDILVATHKMTTKLEVFWCSVLIVYGLHYAFSATTQ